MKRLVFLAVILLCMAAGATAQDDADAKYATGLLKPGTDAPDFVLANPGASYDGTSLRSLRGKYVVLDFWASWCPDCRKDIGKIRTMNARMGSDSIVFVGVSFDKSDEAWRKCVADSSMTWMQHREQKPWKETQISKDYCISWIPTMYLIGPDGRVMLGTVEADKMERMLTQIVKGCCGGTNGCCKKSESQPDSIMAVRYKGGMQALMSALVKNIRYPEIASKVKAEGTVKMTFEVNPDGTIDNITATGCRVTKLQTPDGYTKEETKKLREAIAKAFAREAYRVLKQTDGWKPDAASQCVSMALPVTFRL